MTLGKTKQTLRALLVALGLAVGCGGGPATDAEDVGAIQSAVTANQPGAPGGQCGFAEQLANGDVMFAIKFGAAQANVQVFSEKNGVQNIATSIPGFKNADGTFTYRYMAPASSYRNGDKILARFYHYAPSQPGMFTPGPTGTTFLPELVYGSASCTENIACVDRASTPKYVQQLSNGNLQFSVTLPSSQAYVEVFVQQNGTQTIAQNIVSSGVNNPDGTKTYSMTSAASKYKAGDKILARFFSYKASSPGVFTPGPTENIWAPIFVYGQSNSCVGVTPRLSCVVDLDAAAGGTTRGHFAALFGYDSSYPTDTTIPVGTRNQFVPGAERGQPVVFLPGSHADSVAVSFDDSGITWQLDGASAVATQTSPACSTAQTERIRALRQAQRTVEVLGSIGDTGKRELVSALVLNVINSTNRALAGGRSNAVERRIATYLGTVDPTVLAYLARSGRGLSLIPAAVRQQLLGTMASFDPGDGSQPSNWDDLLQGPISNANARLRAPSCEQAPSSDVTAGIFEERLPGPDGEPALFAADGRPTILGILRNTVSSPHPVLETDHDTARSTGHAEEGDGYFMGGVRTTQACPCDATQGLICDATLRGQPVDPVFSRCVAVPIITQGKDFTLRGYNFWDSETPALVLRPISGANGSTATFMAHESGVDTAPGGSQDCSAASGKTNRTHDSLTFRTSASPGFHRLQLFNQNGHFRYRKEDPIAPGRALHVCWKKSGVAHAPLGIDTNTDCNDSALSATTCAGDGLACPSNIWGTAPRPLAQCQHSFLNPPVCGETPAWVGSASAVESQPIVMVQTGDPLFQVRIHRQAVEAVEESGVDLFGEDETQIMLAAFTDREAKQGFPSLDALKQRMKTLGPDDYDSGTHRVFQTLLPPTNTDQVLSSVNAVTQDEMISMGMSIIEADCKPCIIGAITVFGAAAITGVCIAAAPACAGAGAAGGVLTAGALAYVLATDVNDDMGTMTWQGTPRQISDRIFATHDSNFWPQFDPFNLAQLGALPEPVPAGPRSASCAINQRLQHPFVTDPNQTKTQRGPRLLAGTNFPTVECSPSGPSCAAGNTCIVNRCLPNGSVDGTAGLSYREHRDANCDGGDSFYGVDLVYERRLCIPEGAATGANTTVCQ